MSGSVPTMYRKALLFRVHDMSSSRFTVRIQRLLVASTLIALTGCGHEAVRRVPDSRVDVSPTTARAPSQGRTRGETAVNVAARQVGVPYRYGGNTRSGFDCSGLVQFAWAEAGVGIPRTTSEQWRRMSRVRSTDLRKGDLLFFRIDGRVSHVGMYMGGGRFVHAPSTGRKVSVASLESGFYKDTFVGATRP